MADAYSTSDWQNLLGGLDYSKKNNRKAAQYIMKDGMGLSPGEADGILGKNSSIAFQQAYSPSVVAQTTQAVAPIASATNSLDNNLTSGSTTADSPSRGGLSSLGFNGAYSTVDRDANGNYKGITGDVASQLDQNRDGAAYGGTYLTADGSYMTKNRFMPDSRAQQTYEQYVAGGGKADEVTWRNSNNDAMRNDNQQFANYAGFGLGAVQTGLGILSYFDNKEMNKKNMKLIDQQLANNQDIMKTRTERAGDIKKYFG
jgi:hypothetical protein